MALTQSTLATEIENLVPTSSEAAAAAALAAAYVTYFDDSTVSGASLVSGSTSAGEAAMVAALAGMSAPGAGAASIQAGVTAFWTAQLGLATAMWITAPIVLIPPIIPPVGLVGIAAALTPVFASNTSGGLSLSAAAAAIAAVLHPASLGATVPGSIPPVVPAPIPIL